MDDLVEKAGFKRDMDAAKFAFALAVNRGKEPGPVEGAGQSGTSAASTKAVI